MIKVTPLNGRLKDIIQILLTTDEVDLEISREKLNMDIYDQANHILDNNTMCFLEREGKPFALIGLIMVAPFVYEYALIVDGSRYSIGMKEVMQIAEVIKADMKKIKGRVQMTLSLIGPHVKRNRRFITKVMGLKYEATLKRYFFGEYDVEMYLLGE